MNEGAEPISVTVHGAIRDIPAAEWDACAGEVNPTVSHAFLGILEESGSATARAGWAPQHLALAGPGGRLVGAVPMYLKSHSYGEYVFDWGWADAYERAGGRYFPKLLCAVPFTPVPGPRLLVAPDAPAETRLHLVAGMVELARQRKLSSLHVNFPEARDFEAFEQAGFLPRIGQQFHWTNDGYRDFDDYLAALNSRKRKAVKKERREALAGGIEIDMLTGVRPDRAGLGRVLPPLSRHDGPQMGLVLSDEAVFLDARRAHAGQDRAVHGAARQGLHRRRV